MTGSMPCSALSFTGCMTLDKLLDLSEAWFPYRKILTQLFFFFFLTDDEYAKRPGARHLRETK